jgi:hypothetical protein
MSPKNKMKARTNTTASNTTNPTNLQRKRRRSQRSRIKRPSSQIATQLRLQKGLKNRLRYKKMKKSFSRNKSSSAQSSKLQSSLIMTSMSVSPHLQLRPLLRRSAFATSTIDQKITLSSIPLSSIRPSPATSNSPSQADPPHPSKPIKHSRMC